MDNGIDKKTPRLSLAAFSGRGSPNGPQRSLRVSGWSPVASRATAAGPMPRVFAGWNFSNEDLVRSDFAQYDYKNGVQMGGDLEAPQKDPAPGFLVRALRDVDGVDLDRTQIVKGWLDRNGKTHEKIYDLACSDGRSVTFKNRCDKPVGNTVHAEAATYSNAIGAPAMQAFWSDPDFDPAQRAFYYVRVIEIPTPRWTNSDARCFSDACRADRLNG